MLNDKVYIGQSVKETERWRQHKYFAKNPEITGQYIHGAMNKYGIDNFIYEVIATCRTEEDVNEVEKMLIQQYDSQNKECGYNVASGGNDSWNRGLPKEQQPMYGKKQSDYQKKRMSEVHTGRKNPHSDDWKNKVSISMMGHSTSPEVKEKISKSNKGKNSGKVWTEERKNKLSLAKIGKRRRGKITIEQELKIIEMYNMNYSAREVAATFNCSNITVANVLKRNNVIMRSHSESNKIGWKNNRK